MKKLFVHLREGFLHASLEQYKRTVNGEDIHESFQKYGGSTVQCFI